MTTVQTILLGSAVTTTALTAGLLYAYSCSVMPGLEQVSDSVFIATMQAINRAILNPVFFISFLGAALLLTVSAYLAYGQSPSKRFWLLLAASVIYLIGVLGVTTVGNVPLNEALDAVDVQSASTNDLRAYRVAFERPWNRLHTVRTGASLLALILVITTCLSAAEE